MVWATTLRALSVAEPIAYTIVEVPSPSARSVGPIATVSVPASTTSALAVPASTSALASLVVGQALEDGLAAGPNVDGRCGCGVPYGQSGLAGAELGGVAGERCDRRLAVGGQVRDEGDVGPRRGRSCRWSSCR
jgi:hypothetical protein